MEQNTIDFIFKKNKKPGCTETGRFKLFHSCMVRVKAFSGLDVVYNKLNSIFCCKMGYDVL